MDRRNEKQFVDRMHDIIQGLANSCKTCMRSHTHSCAVCWSRDANNVLHDMNIPDTLDKPTEVSKMKLLDKETGEVLELINAHLGMSIKMIASSFDNLKEHSIQFICRKLLKQKNIVSSNGCPRVYFPAGTPVDAIESISQTFQKTRKGTHGKG
jgi:hypothetical protein